jgi:hypothetical protein
MVSLMPRRVHVSFHVVLVALASAAAAAGTAAAGSSVTATKKHADSSADKALFKSLLKAAAPKLSVKHAKTAHSAAQAVHATNADHATDTERLAGSSRLSYLRNRAVVTSTSGLVSTSPRIAQAACPASGPPTEMGGTPQPVGGGATINGLSGADLDKVVIAQSGPGDVTVGMFPHTDTRPGWIARAVEVNGGTTKNWSITASVICATTGVLLP